MGIIFDKIYVIGSGSICVNILKSLKLKNIKPIAVAYKEHKISPLSSFCNSNSIEFHSFENKQEITDFFIK